MEILLVILFLIAFVITIMESIIYTYLEEDDVTKTVGYVSGAFLIILSLILAIWHVVEFLNTN